MPRSLDLAAIPAELRERHQWVLWRAEKRDGKLTKVPYSIDGRRASSTDPATWTHITGAYGGWQGDTSYNGIGFVFTDDDPYCGIDIDDCLADGKLKPWAAPILERFGGTYYEVSPSGNGVKIFCRGRPARSAKFPFEDGGIEVYGARRYFTLTGQSYNGSQPHLIDKQTAIDWLLSLRPKAKSSETSSDGKIPEGKRHDALVSFVGKCRKLGLTPDETLAAAQAFNLSRCAPPKSAEELRRLVADCCARWGSGDVELVTRCAADVEPEPIRWLWPGRIARGKNNLIVGNPGLGKSQVTLALAAGVSRGCPWPDGAPCERGKVVIVSAEDDPGDTIRPRLEAVGADLSQVHIIDGVRDGEGVSRGLNLGQDLDALDKLLTDLADVALVIIDPITAYLGRVDAYKNADVRGLLAPLGALAARHGAAIVAVSHLSKSGGTDTLLRVSSSLAFTAAARSVWLVGRDPDDDQRRLFVTAKNNIGNDQSGLAFTIESATVPSKSGACETSRIVWKPGEVTVTADQILAASMSAGDDEDRTALQAAKGWLVSLLECEPVPSGQVWKEARAAGHSERTVKRAKAALGVEARKGGMAGGWYWRLPDDPRRGPKNPEECQPFDVAPFGEFGPLRGDAGEVEVEL